MKIGINEITKRYHCSTCDRGYRFHHDLLRHCRYECAQPRYFKCFYCDKLMINKGNMKRHMLRMHPNDPLRFDISQDNMNN